MKKKTKDRISEISYASFGVFIFMFIAMMGAVMCEFYLYSDVVLAVLIVCGVVIGAYHGRRADIFISSSVPTFFACVSVYVYCGLPLSRDYILPDFAVFVLISIGFVFMAGIITRSIIGVFKSGRK